MQQYQSLCVRAVIWVTGMAKGQQRVSAQCKNQTHVAWLTATLLNHWTTEPLSSRFIISLYQPMEENNICQWLFTSCNLEPFFCVQDCHSQNWIIWISRSDTGMRIRQYTRIDDIKPFIQVNVCYHIGHRLEFKYFHLAQFFAACSLSSSSTSS